MVGRNVRMFAKELYSQRVEKLAKREHPQTVSDDQTPLCKENFLSYNQFQYLKSISEFKSSVVNGFFA